VTLPLSPTEWMPAWPDLTSPRLLPSRALASVWSIYWDWREYDPRPKSRRLEHVMCLALNKITLPI
jgi:hypothetical protein